MSLSTGVRLWMKFMDQQNHEEALSTHKHNNFVALYINYTDKIVFFCGNFGPVTILDFCCKCLTSYCSTTFSWAENHLSIDSPFPSDLRAELRTKDETKFDSAGLERWLLEPSSSGSGDGGFDVVKFSSSPFINGLRSLCSTYTQTIMASSAHDRTKSKDVYSSLWEPISELWRHLPYGITECYLSPESDTSECDLF